MAQPHQYPGLGGPLPGASGAYATNLIYQDSSQATPFPAPAGEGPSTNAQTPGRVNLFNRTIEHKVITDDAYANGDDPDDEDYVGPKVLTVKSVTPNPPPHVEYGRIGDN